MTATADIAADATVQAIVQAALDEDIGPGDATTDALVAPEREVVAHIVGKESCVVAGVGVAREVFARVDSRIAMNADIADGGTAGQGATVATVRGPARGILTGERTALNFMQRMSGIATLTRAFVQAVDGRDTVILDTRKTTPTLRHLEKYAVRCGGGTNHRMGLYDRVMIKDNHRKLWRPGRELSLDDAVRAARAACPGLEIEIEVESLQELENALRASPEWVLLDNMSPDRMREAVTRCRGTGCRAEASGGITLASVAAVAASGVDAVSLGCLTHSAPAVDLSLEIGA